MERRAFYTGCIGQAGHYFWLTPSKRLYFSENIRQAIPDFIDVWSTLWDSGLLKNGKRRDVYDGKVFAIPAKGPWIAFVWWDNSVDSRPGSNSGFYVSGFEWEERSAALAFAMEKWQEVVNRQRHPLVLQDG